MIDYRFEILGLDLTEWVKNIPNLPINAGNIGDLVEIPSIELEVDNSKDVFTPGNPNSIFIVDWRGGSVKIYEDDLLIYNGEIRNIQLRDAGHSGTLLATAKINRILNAQIPFFQSSLKTFAEISQDIYANFGIETDPISYGRAIQKQEDLLFYGRANIQTVTAHTVMSAQQFLGDVGICRQYFINDIAFMDFENPDEIYIPIHVFTDELILAINEYSLVESEVYDGYEVITPSGTASKIGANNYPVLNGGIDNAIVIPTLETGINWGETQIALSERELFRIVVQFSKGEFSSWLKLGSAFTVNSAGFGINQDFKVLGIDNSSKLGPIVTGESV